MQKDFIGEDSACGGCDFVGNDQIDDKSVAITISMSVQNKDEFRLYAKNIGVSLSAFIRLACKEYIRSHDV